MIIQYEKKGKILEVILDDIDFDLMKLYNWQIHKKGYLFYPVKYVNSSGVRTSKPVYLHRLVAERMGLNPDLFVEHKDRNTRNNSRLNLRECNHRQNMMNTELSNRNTSGYRGVSFDKSTGKYKVSLEVRGIKKHLGYYLELDEAVRVYKNAVQADKEISNYAI